MVITIMQKLPPSCLSSLEDGWETSQQLCGVRSISSAQSAQCPSEHTHGILDSSLSIFGEHGYTPVHCNPGTTHSPHVSQSWYSVYSLWATEFSCFVFLYKGAMHIFSLRKQKNNKNSLKFTGLEEKEILQMA